MPIDTIHMAPRGQKNSDGRNYAILRAIVFERVSDAEGKYTKGDVFQWTFKSLDESVARRRAIKALERDGEDVLYWREIT